MSSPAKGGGRGAAAAATTTTTAAPTPTPAVAIGQEFLTTTPFLNRDELDLIFFDEYFPGPDESESFKVQHSPAPSAFHDPTNLNNNPSNSISNGDEDDEDDDDDDNDESFPARAAMRQPAAPPLPATSATAAGLPVDNNKSAAASSPRFESQTRKRRAPQQKQKPIAAAASAASAERSSPWIWMGSAPTLPRTPLKWRRRAAYWSVNLRSSCGVKLGPVGMLAAGATDAAACLRASTILLNCWSRSS